MGTFEDIRKLIQDLLAPQIATLVAHQAAMTDVAQSRHNELLARFAIDEKFERLLATFQIDKRLERLEEQRAH
jgi:hypothetical protein